MRPIPKPDLKAIRQENEEILAGLAIYIVSIHLSLLLT